MLMRSNSRQICDVGNVDCVEAQQLAAMRVESEARMAASFLAIHSLQHAAKLLATLQSFWKPD